jgi:hypothetical protein
VLFSFRHAHVLPRYAKVLGWICVGIINVFFVYFSILRAYERGYVWQRMFAFACLVQFLVEVLFYETTECAMVHFLIPDLVRTEVQTAGVALRNIVIQVCTSQSLGLSSSSSSNVLLDAPRYLFVSTNVAEKYPDMLESVLIRSYHSCWPGSYSAKWKFDHFSGASLLLSGGRGAGGGGLFGGFFRGFSVTMILISLLKEFGASSPVLQRLLLHSVQPLLVAAIFFVGSVFLLRPLYWLTLVPVLVYAVHSYRQYRWQLSQDNAGTEEADIYPIEDKTPNVKEEKEKLNLSDSMLASSIHPAPLPPCSAPALEPIISSSEDEASNDDRFHELNLRLGFFDDSSSDSSLGEWAIPPLSSDDDSDSLPESGRPRLSSGSSFSNSHFSTHRSRASSLYSSCDLNTGHDEDRRIISGSSSEEVRCGDIISSTGSDD